jgi:chaperonin GroES
MTYIAARNDRVFVRRAAKETTTASGIVLTDKSAEKTVTGTVVAVGPGRVTDAGYTAPMGLWEGDEVLFSKVAGDTVKIDGEELVVLAERDIYAVLRPSAERAKL